MNDRSTPALTPLQIELREAMQGWGCPLCKLSHKAEQAFIESLNYERVLDLKTRDALKASRGLCERHSRDWRHVQGAALGLAIVYKVTLLDLLRDTEDDDEEKRGGFLGWGSKTRSPEEIADALEAQRPCPACEIGTETAERFAGILLDNIVDTEVQQMFQEAGGLCLPHLRMTLRQKEARRSASTLIAVQRDAWSTLMDDLEAFIRKNDYRFREEKMTPEEETAWTRVLDVVVGLDPNRVSRRDR